VWIDVCDALTKVGIFLGSVRGRKNRLILLPDQTDKTSFHRIPVR
jgi:hypothetical protein